MKLPFQLSICFVAAALIAGSTPARAQDANARAKEIVRKMTLQEKIDELHGIHTSVHQRYVPPVPRLHIPALVVTNGPAGAGPGDPTPQQPATARRWPRCGERGSP